MAVQLSIDYDQLVELVEQLSEEQQQALIAQLLADKTSQHPLTADEKIQLLDSAKIRNAVNQSPSIHRSDWYNDDGR